MEFFKDPKFVMWLIDIAISQGPKLARGILDLFSPDPVTLAKFEAIWVEVKSPDELLAAERARLGVTKPADSPLGG